MKRIRIIVYPICIVLFLVSAWNLHSIWQSTRKITQMYASLAEIAHADEEKQEEVDEEA